MLILLLIVLETGVVERWSAGVLHLSLRELHRTGESMLLKPRRARLEIPRAFPAQKSLN
jgi:hypothetical protein